MSPVVKEVPESKETKPIASDGSGTNLTRRLSIPRCINTLATPSFKLPNASFAKCWSEMRREDKKGTLTVCHFLSSKKMSMRSINPSSAT